MSTAKLNPIIDADVICYRVGFAVKDDEPVEYALATVKHVLENIMDRFPDATYRRVFLTGKGNFRDSIATLQTYKGNRDPNNRPKYYDEIRQYLVEHQGAEVIDGQEADDAQGIEQWRNKDKSTVIVGIDKDLYMIPGFHYNWVKDKIQYISLADANYNFFKQMLEGDRTDNIPGITGVGPKTAEKLLAPCNKDVIAMSKVVKEQYKKQYGDKAREAYREVANLLWIRREEGQVCPF